MPVENDTKRINTPSASAGDGNAEEAASRRQRSLLRTLWSEAASANDLPLPTVDGRRLHHRRANKGSLVSSRHSCRGFPGDDAVNSFLPSAKRRVYRAGLGSRIGERVWLAAFAAFATSFLIVIHLFLYQVLMGSANGKNGDGSIGDEMQGSLVATGMPVLGIDDQQAKMTMAEARSRTLAPITQHPVDTDQYTIRMNTWRRNEQLLLSINHHSRCEGVREIQIVWCDSENEPPEEVVRHYSGKVRVERHAVNSLNERFKVMIDPPTIGILSLDDDILRPCVALDAAFIRWTRHPGRMVGFDARSHVVVDDNETNGEKSDKRVGGSKRRWRWKYGYMSTTESSNHYSITLPRASFLHRDYLDLYVMALPRKIYTYVAQNLECEDIAMSFLVSSLTDGKPPLVADYWAVKSMVKLYSSRRISGGKDHKSTRDACVDDFADLLGLKQEGEWPLQTGKLLHKGHFFGYGTEPEEWSAIEPELFQSTRLQEVIKKMQELQMMSGQERRSWMMREQAGAMEQARGAGMIEKTEEWMKRWAS